MKSSSDTKERRMPSAAIATIVFVVVFAVVAGVIWVTERPTLPAVTGAPVVENVDPENATEPSATQPDASEPDAFIEQSGQFVTPEDTDDETTVVDPDPDAEE